MKTNNTGILKAYLQGVMNRADHHANAIRGTVLTLTGAIVWCQDDDEGLQIKTYNGALGNVLWCQINGQRWCMAYNHVTYKIEMRRDGLNGPAVYSFDDTTHDANDIRQIFLGLLNAVAPSATVAA